MLIALLWLLVIIAGGVLFLLVSKSMLKDLDTESRQDAPSDLREPTEKEKNYFINNYQKLLEDTSTQQYKDYINNLSKTLKIKDAKLIDIDNNYNGDLIMVAVNCDERNYECLDISMDYKDVLNLQLGADMVLFCAVDESGTMKIITSADKTTVNSTPFNIININSAKR